MDSPINIVWLKRDLRIEDHLALFAARKRGRIIALYGFEPDYWACPDASGRQWNFIRESLHEVSTSLAKLGIPLLLFNGTIETAFETLIAEVNPNSIHAHQETGNLWTFERDKRVLSIAAKHNIPFIEHMQHGVFRCLDTRNGWAARWDAMMLEPGPPLPARQEWPTKNLEALRSHGFFTNAEDLPKIPDNCPDRQSGGRERGLALLASFLGGRGENYRKAMSSPLEGADACSRISSHLAYGTLSMRETFQAAVSALRALDKENPAHKKMRQSLVSFIGRLHWHCHFIQKLETTPAIEWRELHPAYRGMRTELNEELLERWVTGNLGWPFMDACMRSLRATGWLNFRMRAMVTSVASYHLWQPWQKSGNLLAALFTDYEPGIHWPQIQMQSGTTGINTIRMYNPIKQGYDQDRDGVFIRKWVPELCGLEGKDLHEPWKLSAPPKDYPSIVLDHQVSAREAREKIWLVRKRGGFKRDAKEVLEKHSSRKSLKQPDHNRAKKPPKHENQISFDF
jgi:deoxyribodipyrimidine photo-lyase